MNERYYTGALGPMMIEDLVEVINDLVDDAGDDGITLDEIIKSIAAIGDVNELQLRRLIRRRFDCRRFFAATAPYKLEIIVRLKV